MDDFARLVKAAGDVLGIEGLEPDAGGVVEFVSEEASVTVMHCPDAGDMVLFSAQIAPAPEYDAAAAWREALAANTSDATASLGAAISIDPDDGSFFFSLYRPLRLLTTDSFLSTLEGFSSSLLSIRDRLGF